MPDGQSPGNHARRIHPALWYGGLLAAVVEVFWATRRVGFFQDDFVFLGQARWSGRTGGEHQATGLTWSYLSEALYEHFSPVTRGLFWFVARFDNVLLAVRIAGLLCIAAVIVGFGSVAKTILGQTVPALLVTLVAAQGLVITRLGAWTTAGFNILPAVACSAVTLSFGIRYLRSPERPLRAVIALGAFVVACADYELAMLLPAFLGLWFVLVGPVERSVRAAWTALRDRWWFWLSMAVIAGATAVNYRVGYYIGTLPRGTVRSSVKTLWYGAWHGLFPAVVGLWSPLAGNLDVSAIAALLIWVSLVALALWVGRGAVVPALVLAFSGWLIYTALLGYARSAVNTPAVGIELYYAAFPLLILVLGGCETLRLCIERRNTVTLPRWVQRLGARRDGGVVTTLLGSLVVLSAVMLQVNAGAVTSVSGVASKARQFERAFLDDVNSVEDNVAVLSDRVPNEVVFAMFYPYNWASASLGELTTGVRWNDASGDDLHRIDADGHLVPVELQPGSTAGPVGNGTTAAPSASGGQTSCFTFAESDRRLRYEFDVPIVHDGSTGLPFVLLLTGEVSSETLAVIEVITETGTFWPVNGDAIEWRGTFATAHVIDAPAILGLDVTGLRPGTELCLDRVEATTIRDRA